MKRIEFSKINGKIDNVDALHGFIDRNVKYLMNGRYTLQIVGKRRQRSIAQNSLMWLWFACIEQETGQYAQDIHDYYCLRFLPKEITDLHTGELVTVGGHTSTLTSEAFADFLNKIQSDAASELGITLPNPGDTSFESFENDYKQYTR